MTARTPGLLERDDQASAIDAVLAAGRRGEGRLLLIEGPPGIGKSRLLQELRTRADGPARVLSARASKLEQAFAFGVVRQLLEAVTRDAGDAATAFEGAASGARSIFDDAPSEGSGASYAILHGLHWLTLNLAETQPLVLVIDDLHWCDASSLRFLSYLARRIESTRVVLAATTRPLVHAVSNGDVGGDVLVELLDELLSEPDAVLLHPLALSPDASAALLAETLGTTVDPAFAAACFEATDGNPLMLRQLAHSLQAEGTTPTAEHATTVRRVAHRALARTVLSRVGRLPATTVAVAHAAAVLGETASVSLVAELAGTDPDTVVTATSELVAAEVLRRDTTFGFVHALVRDAIYHDLPEAARAQLHARAAKLLATAGAPAERVASQLDLAPRTGDPWAVEIATLAADAAVRRAAPDAAAAYLRRALDEPAPPELRAELTHRLGTVLVDVNGPQAAEVLREAVALAPDPLTAAAIEVELLQMLVFTGGQHEANAIARARAKQVPPDAIDLQALLATFRANSATFGAHDPEAFVALRPTRTKPMGDGFGSRALASLTSLMWACDGGTAEECAKLALWSMEGEEMLMRRQPMPAAGALLTLSLADRPESLGFWEDARAEGHRTGAQLLHWTIDVWLGAERLRRGDLSEAISLLEEATRIGRRWTGGAKIPFGNQFSESSLALALLDRGDVDQARARLDASPLVPNETVFSGHMWLASDAQVKLAEGRFEEALESTIQQERRSEWMQVPLPCDWRGPRATALHRLGRTDEALVVADEALKVAEHWGAPRTVGPALRLLGELRGEAGLPDLERSVAVLEHSTARLELAKSLAALGAARRRSRQPTEARAPLERAYELARACDATAVAEAIRTELAASGVRRPRDEVGGAGALTPSERRVADLAADGRSNREIAQELFVTPKTVEVHLSAAYRKLGITSRHALPGALV